MVLSAVDLWKKGWFSICSGFSIVQTFGFVPRTKLGPAWPRSAVQNRKPQYLKTTTMVHLNQSVRYRRYQQDISAFISFAESVKWSDFKKCFTHHSLSSVVLSRNYQSLNIQPPKRRCLFNSAFWAVFNIQNDTPGEKEDNCILNSVKRFSCDSKVFGNFSNSLRLHSSASNLTRVSLRWSISGGGLEFGPYLRWSMKKLNLVWTSLLGPNMAFDRSRCQTYQLWSSLGRK